MGKNNLIKGVLLVALGASSYGMLATFVKLAYEDGYTTPEVTLAQLVIGLICMWGISLLSKNKIPNENQKIKKGDTLKLILSGTSLGLTTLFYYITVKYVSVSIAIVLLMQTIWISVVLEAFLLKKIPSLQKIISVVCVLIGTLLTTDVFASEVSIDYRGIIFGFLSAISFTTTMFASNRIATYLSPYKKSSIMLIGGFIAVVSYCIVSIEGTFNFSIFYKWGIILALFGTIIPPLSFNSGFPKTGLGIGSIVSSIELPVSVVMAYLVLKEQVVTIQIIGIILILSAVIIMNVKFSKNK